jgi:hypothetical protein
MGDLSDDDDDEFQPMELMPSSRLQDIVNLLDKGVSSVVTVDACLPPKEAGEQVLKTLLFKVQPCVKVLSLRFNQLSQYSCDLLTEWVSTNDHLETLYVMGSGFDEKSRSKLEDAWKKKLISHRSSNLGFTLIRVTHDKLPSKDA